MLGPDAAAAIIRLRVLLADASSFFDVDNCRRSHQLKIRRPSLEIRADFQSLAKRWPIAGLQLPV